MLNRGDNMIQIYDKFSLSKDNNIFLAKRNKLALLATLLTLDTAIDVF